MSGVRVVLLGLIELFSQVQGLCPNRVDVKILLVKNPFIPPNPDSPSNEAKQGGPRDLKDIIIGGKMVLQPRLNVV